MQGKSDRPQMQDAGKVHATGRPATENAGNRGRRVTEDAVKWTFIIPLPATSSVVLRTPSVSFLPAPAISLFLYATHSLFGTWFLETR